MLAMIANLFTFFLPLLLCLASPIVLRSLKTDSSLTPGRMLSVAVAVNSLLVATLHKFFSRGYPLTLFFQFVVLIIAGFSFVATVDIISDHFLSLGVLSLSIVCGILHATFYTVTLALSREVDLGYFGYYHRGVMFLVWGVVGFIQYLRGPIPGNPPPPPPPTPLPPPTTDPTSNSNSSVTGFFLRHFRNPVQQPRNQPPPSTDPSPNSGSTETSLPPSYTPTAMLTFCDSPEPPPYKV